MARPVPFPSTENNFLRVRELANRTGEKQKPNVATLDIARGGEGRRGSTKCGVS